MFWKRTALAVGMCLAASCGLCALDLQYGSFFKVRHITLQQGRPVLPLARGKYANLRILDRETFRFVQACPAVCRQPAASADPQVTEIRAALTRPGMWIAEVSFGGQWQITFLIFKNQNGYAVKEPDDFIFLDGNLKQQVRQLLVSAASRGEAAARGEKQ